MHVNIWPAEPVPSDVLANVPALVVVDNALRGEVTDRGELDDLLARLRQLRVQVVTVEVSPE